MQCLTGRVSKFLPEPAEGLSGLVLDGGREIYFLQEYRVLVNTIARIGTKVEIQGFLIADSRAGGKVGATRITNLDTRELINMDFPDPRSTPEMLARGTPPITASDAHVERGQKNGAETHCGQKVAMDQRAPTMDSVSTGGTEFPSILTRIATGTRGAPSGVSANGSGVRRQPCLRLAPPNSGDTGLSAHHEAPGSRNKPVSG
jgi:hypothetical protein